MINHLLLAFPCAKQEGQQATTERKQKEMRKTKISELITPQEHHKERNTAVHR